MDKRLFSLLLAPSLLFTWNHASANETHEFITDSSDQDQGRRSSQVRDDLKGSRGDQGQGRGFSQGRDNPSRGDQGRGGSWDSQRQQPQMQQPQMQQPQMQQPNQDSRGMKSGGGDWDRNQNINIEPKRDYSDKNQRKWDQNNQRDIEQKRDSQDQRWRGDSDQRDGGDWDKDRKDRGDHRGERFSRERFKERENRWQSKSREWRKRFSDHRHRDHIFDDHFWDQFRRTHTHWYFDNSFQWYTWATWPRIVVWLPWQWNRPIYYFYETNGDVYYSTTEDFTYLTPVESKEVFIAQAVRIANARYPISNQQSDWLPLGMFTFASENDSSDMPKRYISLAVSKMGAVSGAYFDAANNSTFEIQGGIDPESQRIAWKFVGSDWPIMESGLYNLTKEESTLLIHTSSRATETQLLIRLDR